MNDLLKLSNYNSRFYSGVFFYLLLYIYNNMKQNDKTNPIVIEHWKNKFEKGVRVLLKSGHRVDELIESITKIQEEEKSKQNNETTI